MKMKTILTFSLGVLLTCSLNSQTTLINNGSTWKYYDAGDEPDVQGSLEWNDSTYNDSSWSSGPAQLGYGDGGEATVLADNPTYTAYFRHEFNVSNPAQFDFLGIDLTFDDGAVVYLNGTELFRENMPTGTIDYNTFASGASSDDELFSTTVANTLVTGSNQLSVEVHQVSTGSSDISFDFKMTGLVAGAAIVERGPYLQKATPNSMTVKWRTDIPNETVVHYGTTEGSLTSTASNLTDTTEHQIEITGLTPNTIYYYDIADTSNVLVGGSPQMYFKTPPISGTVQSMRAWILGDCGTADGLARSVRDAYNTYIGSDHTDMMLFLGDNAYNDGTDNQYQGALFENMYEDNLRNTVAWSCLGNHDGISANSSNQTGPYYDIFTFPKNGEAGGVSSGTEAYYSFDHGNAHFISLESHETDRSVGGAMYNWCKSDLQNTTADWIVAFWHHPPYTKGSHDSDVESQLIDMREHFLPLLDSFGVDLVLSGHSHSYERSYLIDGHYGNSTSFNSVTHTVGTNGDGDGKVDGDGAYEKVITGPDEGDGAVYITTGSAGKITGSGPLDHEAMYYSVKQLGSCVLEISNDTMNVKFLRETGAVEDYFSIIKPLNCTPGAACDDLDSCTVADTFDVSCNCVGTFQDTDSDGVCDASDLCPGFDDTADADSDGVPDGCDICPGFDDTADADSDSVPDGCDICPGFDDALDGDSDGVPDGCDLCPGFDDALDGDSDGVPDGCDICPGFDDTVDTDSDGVPNGCDICPGFDDALDGDSDGVPDGCDLCPGFDDALDGDSDGVPDGCDLCPGSDDTADADSDGIPDGCDICPGSDDTVDTDSDGTPDGCDLCPGSDDTVDTDSDGTPDGCDLCPGSDDTADADSDGVPDGCDLCPGLNDNLIGTACNDSDTCTTGDVYDNNCQCAGTYVDQDGDGYCVGDDPDDLNPCDPDTNSQACLPCMVFNSESFESGWGIWIDGGSDCYRTASNPNSGTYSIRIQDNSLYTSSFFTGDLDLSNEEEVILSFSYLPIGLELNEDFFLEISTDGGSSYSIYQEWDCGFEFQNGIRYYDTVSIIHPFTSNSRLRIRCDASGNDDQVYFDDVVIQYCNEVCFPGTSCNDGDTCTTNDIVDINCNCVGTYADTDNDGVCDTEDQCPGQVDSLMGTACDDLDSCTINDLYDANCTCIGTYVDNDNDGYCTGADPDDNDPCNPDASPGCDDCPIIISDGFESNFGNWNDGGSDCSRRSRYPNTGSYSIRIRDNSGNSSSMISDVLDLSNYSTIKFEFSFYPVSMEVNEDFMLELSTDGGSSYSVVQSWVRDTDFDNKTRYDESVDITSSFTSNTRLRLRCDASGNGDKIFIDDIVITGCPNPARGESIDPAIVDETPLDPVNVVTDEEKAPVNTDTREVLVYPNPASNNLYMDLSQFMGEGGSLLVYNIQGVPITRYYFDVDHAALVEVPLDKLNNGVYLLNIQVKGAHLKTQRLIITK